MLLLCFLFLSCAIAVSGVTVFHAAPVAVSSASNAVAVLTAAGTLTVNNVITGIVTASVILLLHTYTS